MVNEIYTQEQLEQAMEFALKYGRLETRDIIERGWLSGPDLMGMKIDSKDKPYGEAFEKVLKANVHGLAKHVMPTR